MVTTSVLVLLIYKKKSAQNGESGEGPGGRVVSPVSRGSYSKFMLCEWFMRAFCCTDVELRENSGRSKAEPELYENMRAKRESADDTYQSLCVDTMDPNQIYSSI
ncbi:hypothetical protein WMY93_014832 [Mugilogobius chulae]|uniref:Uncharacterized protein n=1 Tax=Mugilogobius chulae TaxID=88201 RepID=A0AAW0P0B8_9GOBI